MVDLVTFSGDLHTHSIASGHAYSTITEMAQAAASKGLEYLAITDHGPNMPGAAHLYYFGNLPVISREIAGVKILRGVEANIIGANGELDLPDKILAKLDWVLVGFHPDTGYHGDTIEVNTQALKAALANPHVDAVVHPGNPHYPIDYQAVVAAAAKYGKAIEINNASLTITRTGSTENCQTIAEFAAQANIKVIIDSDAHFAEHIGKLSDAYRLARSSGIQDEQIVNLTAQGIEEFLRSRGKIIVPA